MAEDTWYSQAQPILEAVQKIEGTREALFLTVTDLAHRTALDAGAVSVETRRLIESGYLAGEFKQPFAGDNYVQEARLTAKGAQKVGLWPSNDPYEAVVALLERRIADAPDEPTRSKWQKVRDTLTGLGTDVGTNFLASVLFEIAKAVP